MGKYTPTPAQSAAIDTRDRALLVSAAAGSGKTATLTQRIIKILTEEGSDTEPDVESLPEAFPELVPFSEESGSDT